MCDCPKCGWSPLDREKEYKLGGPVLRKITDYEEVHGDIDYLSWIEHYRCPKCKTEFTVDSGT